jgi:glycosyltransferase involved in cell wall biosynthesis
LKNGVPEKSIEIIYNKVNEDLFFPTPNIKTKYAKMKPGAKLEIINVQTMTWEKNQECLIRALQGLQGIHMTLIGNGPLYEQNVRLAKQLKANATFIRKVDNKDLPTYYRKADVFATAIRTGGVSIPVLESMASGLPIIHGIFPLEPKPDVIPEIAMHIPTTPESFRKKFIDIQEKPSMLQKYSSKSLAYFQTIKGSIQTRKEAVAYQKLLINYAKNK